MGMQTAKIHVSGMTCGNCARSVERKLSNSPGVSSARVDLAAGVAAGRVVAAQVVEGGSLVAAPR